MDYDKKQAWIKALLSGEYKQGIGTLKKVETVYKEDGSYDLETQHCCLGVLCEAVPGIARVEGTFIKVAGSGNLSAFDDSEAAAIGLPPDVQTELIKLNDDEARDFAFIAGYIEAKVPVTHADQRPLHPNEQ